MREKKFSRCEPDQRRDLLVRSAIRCLEAEGHAGLSVRKITKEANVSQGMVNHHFGSMNALITQAYDVLSQEFMQSISALLENNPNTAADKLDIIFQQNFAKECMSPSYLRAWLVFWSLIPNSPEMAEAYTRNNRELETLLGELLTEISHEDGLVIDDISIASQSLMAVLDGLWVRESIEHRENATENALSVARNWLKMFRGGMFS
ncbi:TetR family transcriptional regulator C-terminal domain-containing protein [Vibrio hippocampi]|uniref:HTH-type transcriptional regulator BetI n=1 Tax=Vibrio hippocampi TaxID=654686 RepID=A0ABN8DPI0_9VIBR|nr:TetR family transcriptional regulator C-terminal domain-containing protein [Vibrio hippocampi]CAH0529868.1 HTH-type transcriptional regulator BetI [Vibrio hippocampi]